MEILVWMVVAVGICFVLLLVAGGVIHWLEHRVVSSRYEWLDVLSHYEWKMPRQMRDDMSKLKGRRVFGRTLFVDLGQLEEEGLIDSRVKTVRIYGYSLILREYKLTPSGTRRKANEGKEVGREARSPLQPV